MKDWQNNCIFGVSLVADIVTIIPGISKIANIFFENPSPFILGIFKLIAVFCFIITICYILFWVVKRKCIKHGTHGIPCSIYSLYHARFKNHTHGMLYAMHMIYHEMYKARHEIINDRKRYYNQETIKPVIDKYLDTVVKTLQTTLRIKVRLSVKKMTREENTIILKTYTYVVDKMDSELEHRKFNDYIVLVNENELYDDITSWCKASRKYAKKHGNGRYASNSIFNYMIGNGIDYWMSNDLDVE